MWSQKTKDLLQSIIQDREPPPSPPPPDTGDISITITTVTVDIRVGVPSVNHGRQTE